MCLRVRMYVCVRVEPAALGKLLSLGTFTGAEIHSHVLSTLCVHFISIFVHMSVYMGMQVLNVCTCTLMLHARTWRYVQGAMLDWGGLSGSTFSPLPPRTLLPWLPGRGREQAVSWCLCPAWVMAASSLPESWRGGRDRPRLA